MFFKNKTKKTTKKIDKLVTGLIIGGAVAGMVGISKTKKGKEVTQNFKKKSKGFFSTLNLFFGKTSIKIIDFFNKFKK